MHIPEHFAETRPEELHGLIQRYPLGALVINGPHGLDANHLPFELDAPPGEAARLHAHVARANPLWSDVRDGDDVLVIFRSAGAYVSPSWYPSKAETHRHVPTWNYQVLHVHGRIKIRDDEKFVRAVVARLTRTHEARAASARPWKMGDAPPDFMEQMLRAIVGIEIEIIRMAAKWKLGQNREARDRAGAADALDARGAQEIANAMRGAGHKD
jgi:transcriptional regulator